MKNGPDRDALYVQQLELGPMRNFVYLVGCARTREVAVVDPAWEIDRLLAVAEREGVRIVAAIATHRHFDHVNGLHELLEQSEVPVFAHALDADHVGLPRSSVRAVEDGATVTLGDVTLRLVHTPGHTPGSQCVLAGPTLFSGDTLFIQGCGRCDLDGGDPALMYDTLYKVLAKLDPDTRVYPGHNYAEQPVSTLGEERRDNPFLQFGDRETFVEYRNERSRRRGMAT